MTFLIITIDFAGQVGVKPRLVRIYTDATFSELTATNFLRNSVIQGYTFDPTDMALVSYGNNITQFFALNITSTTITLEPVAGDVTLPVVSGNFAIFSGTSGALEDAGYAPTNAAKTKVVMANTAVTSGNIAEFTDTVGTVGDGAIAANQLLTSSIVTPDVGINLIAFDITVGEAALAVGGSVTLIASSGSKRYKMRSLQLNSGGTNFSGGGGDRLGQVTDGTTVYSVIPAATMQTLANAQWGVTALPNPASAAINTSTVAGANLVFKYSGGTTDYTAGSLVISGIAQRVA